MEENRSTPLILVVENDPRVRQLIMEWINHSDLECRFAEADGSKAAFAQVKNEPPDVILMDISMPYVDGIQTTRVIHRIAPEIPVVMLTIMEESHYKAEARKAGALDFVNKREMTTRLLPVLKRVLKKNDTRSRTTLLSNPSLP